MTSPCYLAQVAICSITISFGAILGVSVLGATEAEGASKQQCKAFNGGSTRGLAITGNVNSNECVCPPQSSVYQRRERQVGSAAARECFIQTPQKITNFNLPNNPPGTPPGVPPGEPPTGEPPTGEPPGPVLAGANPGNHLQVGNATENPPQGNGSLSKFGISNPNSTVTNRRGETVCCEGGDKGASDSLD